MYLLTRQSSLLPRSFDVEGLSPAICKCSSSRTARRGGSGLRHGDGPATGQVVLDHCEADAGARRTYLFCACLGSVPTLCPYVVYCRQRVFLEPVSGRDEIMSVCCMCV